MDVDDRQMPSSNNTYTELLYAHLLDADGSRLTYTHFTSRVPFKSLIDLYFNRPVFIQRNKVRHQVNSTQLSTESLCFRRTKWELFWIKLVGTQLGRIQVSLLATGFCSPSAKDSVGTRCETDWSVALFSRCLQRISATSTILACLVYLEITINFHRTINTYWVWSEFCEM